MREALRLYAIEIRRKATSRRGTRLSDRAGKF